MIRGLEGPKHTALAHGEGSEHADKPFGLLIEPDQEQVQTYIQDLPKPEGPSNPPPEGAEPSDG